MKIIVRIVTLISLVSVFLFTTCDNPMGMGKPIDLEPPSIIITGIILPDGSEMTLQEEDNKLFIGPVILEGPGFFLKGTAYDNELVTEIIVEETGTNAEIVDGKPRRWTNAVIGARKSAAGGGGGEQDWRISLDGISNGERNIRVTVYDFPRNTGPDSVKQLTLLIDTEPPFVEKVYIERQPGITAQLMSLALLEGMDPTQFQHIDYFQNEKFTIRASIEHDFSLSGVTLNLLDSDGNELFTPGLERTSGTTEYAPSWLITADQLIAANPVYAGGGPHYLKVSITARAEAGHSGEYEDKVNFMFNLCWYPDADIPQIQMTTDKPEAEPFRKGDKISLRIFDDDNIGEVYAAMIKEVDWEDSILESIDDEKFQELIIAFSDYPELNENRLSAAVRNTVIEIDVPDTRGNYRLVVLAKDKKDSGDSGVWAAEKYDIKIVEEGIPIITITSPLPNISPLLANGENFTIKGTVQNLDDLDEIKIAWIPAGAGLPTNTANAEGEKALLSGDTDTFDYGIKIWKLPLEPGKPSDKDPQKKSQDFSKTFDIFTDFMYEGDIENETKFFILYVQGKDGDDVFESIRFMAYKKPPVLVINSPQNFDEFPPSPAPGSEIYFDIESSSANGMEIDTVTISFIEDGTDKSITLDIVAGKCTWTHSRTDKNEYSYRITSTDKLGISKEEIRTIIVKTLPVLTKITSPHNSGVVFSGRDTITIQAVFDDIVTRVVSTGTETGTPRLLLGGLTTTDNQLRYAYYPDTGITEPNSTTLNFVYTIQPGDYTGALGPSNGLQVTALQLNDGTISAEEPFTITSNDLLNTKWLNVDARAPTITKIELTGEDGDDDYPNWFRAGATLKAELTIDKEIRVLGTPKLELQFNGSAIRYASYVKMSGTKIMVFEYKIQQGDEAEPVVCDADTCFSGGDLQMITDKIGSNGNFLLIGTPSITGTVYVDAVPPLAPEIIIDNTQSTNNSKTIQIKPDNVESTATKQYTTDNWLTTKTIGEGDVTDWTNITDPYTLPPINQSNNYLVIARQIDRAGNVSPDSDIIDIEIGGSCDIIAILCDNPNGAYPAGSNLTFKLAFSGKVYNDSDTGTSITLSGIFNGVSGTNVINFSKVSKTNADFTLSASWNNIPEGIIMEPVTVTNITLASIIKDSDDAPLVTTPATLTDVVDDFDRPDLKVLSVRPTITNIIANDTTYQLTDNNIVLAAANDTITLKFSHPVWPEVGRNTNPVAPEVGTIVIRPADGWYIPPVLSSEDYYKVSSALSGANLTTLESNYTETTHGLKKSDTNYVPDIDTKYVLKFTEGLNNATLRPVFDAAHYLWQEVESVSSEVSGAGTDTIMLKLPEPLPNGRQWKIEINEAAFRDEAGNTFTGWNTTTDYRFWSQKTATPVIRVNRVSNNNYNIDPTDNTISGDKGTDTEVTSRVNVQYRIDCETPGATITSSTWFDPTNGIATIDDDMTSADTYGAYSEETSPANSSIPDATFTQLESMAAGTAYPGTTGGTTGQITDINTYDCTIGDTSLYTARKDYIAAQATRTLLSASDKGYEGAFKTLIIYRNPPAWNGTLGTDRFVKLEATNTRNGAVTISGFPMDYNDRSGLSSKYVYQNTAAATHDDWIWISWEIVSDFWQVGMMMTDGTPNSSFEHDAWNAFGGDWYAHNYRKYGNYGLRVGGN